MESILFIQNCKMVHFCWQPTYFTLFIYSSPRKQILGYEKANKRKQGCSGICISLAHPNHGTGRRKSVTIPATCWEELTSGSYFISALCSNSADFAERFISIAIHPPDQDRFRRTVSSWFLYLNFYHKAPRQTHSLWIWHIYIVFQ